jgi:hypothetical protein
MTSISLQRMISSVRKTNKLDSFSSLNTMPIADRQIFYHACIAMDVASWDGYINNIIREYHGCIGGINNVHLLNFRVSQSLLIERRLDKFNTPNFDNTRNLIIECTGFDPVSIWNWPQRLMIWQAVQARLNEILKVRHSFAHGLSFPNYTWMPQKNGQAYLNKNTATEIERLLVHLATVLDSGLKNHMTNQFGSNCTPWR